jgi:hypothetical protein
MNCNEAEHDSSDLINESLNEWDLDTLSNAHMHHSSFVSYDKLPFDEVVVLGLRCHGKPSLFKSHHNVKTFNVFDANRNKLSQTFLFSVLIII